MVVGGSTAECTSASVTLQCTVTGNSLTWTTPDGQLILIRGVHTDLDRDLYRTQLQEINATHLRSNLTFINNDQISFICTDSENTAEIITVSIEGNCMLS